jgi:GTPase SAR1 family protein
MRIVEKNGCKIAVAENIDKINNTQDALDKLVTAYYQGSDSVVFYKENLSDSFFDLRTGLAGEVLQKFSNYNVRLAIVGNFNMYKNKALRDFIYECNKNMFIIWVSDLETALNTLALRK